MLQPKDSDALSEGAELSSVRLAETAIGAAAWKSWCTPFHLILNGILRFCVKVSKVFFQMPLP